MRILAALAILACLVFWSWLLLRRNERLLLEATRRAERLGPLPSQPSSQLSRVIVGSMSNTVVASSCWRE